MGKTCSLSSTHICAFDATKTKQKSKAQDHTKYLLSRLELWKNGELDKLIEEGKEIQKRMLRKKKKTEESNLKAFSRLMLVGKVKQATKFISNDDCVVGVHKITESVKFALANKHSKAKDPSPDAMLTITKPPPDPVINEQITAEVI